MAVEVRDTKREAAPPARPALWNDPQVHGLVYQVLAIGAVIAGAWFLISNAMENLAKMSAASGFGFLEDMSSFEIGESVIPFAPEDNYLWAFLAGMMNTLKVALFGIVLATILGTTIGIARLSTNWLVAKLAWCFIEVIRNIPLLLQMIFWHTLLIRSLPSPRQAWSPLAGVYLSNRGFSLPVPAEHPTYSDMLLAFLAGCALSVAISFLARRSQERTGAVFPVFWPSVALILGLPTAVFVFGGAPIYLDVPVLEGFNFEGGMSLSPEFAAVLFALTTYTSAFIAENVRSGILGVDRGQVEGAMALGLRRGQVLRLVVLPQALRIIIPPVTSQYLSLTKNSSLAVAIGYPEIFRVTTITISETGQAIEGITILMAVYLTISLIIAVIMNLYNRHVAIVER